MAVALLGLLLADRSDAAPRPTLATSILDLDLAVGSEFYFDDNLLSEPVDALESWVLAVSPSLSLQRRRGQIDWSARYVPTLKFHLDEPELDNASHAFDLQAGYRPADRLRFALIQQFYYSPDDISGARRSFGSAESESTETSEDSVEAPIIEADRRGDPLELRGANERFTSTTQLAGRWGISRRFQATSEVSHRFDQVDSDSGLSESVQSNWIDYLASRRLSVGLGASFGVSEEDEGESETFQQLRARAIFRFSRKLSGIASAGLEFRQFSGGGDSSVDPVFNLELGWNPTKRLALALDLRRSQRQSFDLDLENTIDTGAGLSVSYKLLRGLRWNIGGSWSVSESTATEKTEDYYWALTSSLDHSLGERIGWGVFFEHRTGDTDSPSESYIGNRYGIQIRYLF